MAHLNAYLAPCPGYGWEGGPTFSTQLVELSNGRERRNANWAQARHRYTAPYNNISIQAYREIKRMHLVCRGMLHAFRFRDVLDHTATNELFETGDGVRTEFQLVATSILDTVAYVRNINAIASITSLTVDGVEKVLGLDYTVDMDRGIITFAAPPAMGTALAWSGVFDIWVRFDTDDMPFTLDSPRHTNGSVSLVEVSAPVA